MAELTYCGAQVSYNALQVQQNGENGSFTFSGEYTFVQRTT
jgi:hypothetical protein